MNVQKSELKMALVKDIGKTLEDRETAHMAEVHRLEGATSALKQGAENLDSVKAFYQKEVEEEKFEEKDLEVVMKAIDRCRGILISLSDVAKAQKLVKQGEAQEAKKMSDLIEKLYHDERAKLAAVLKGIDDGTITSENVGRAVDGSPTIRVVDGGRPTNDTSADLAARRASARAERDSKVDERAAPEAPSAPAVEAKVPEPEVKAEPPAPETPRPPTPSPKRQVISRRQKS